MKNNKVKKILCGLCSMILLGGSCQTVPVMADMGNGSFGQPITGIMLASANFTPKNLLFVYVAQKGDFIQNP